MHHRRKFSYKEASQKKNGKAIWGRIKQIPNQLISFLGDRFNEGNPRHVNDSSVTETQNFSIRQMDNLSEQDLSDALDILSSINIIKQKIK